MESVERVEVRLPQHSYEVLIEPGLLSSPELKNHVFCEGKASGSKRCFVVTVPRVRRLWAKTLLHALKGHDICFLEMQDGERYKTLESVEKLATQMIKAGADRDSVVIALGGGVVTDTAGLLASLYMRGIGLVQAPTTLLAQIDAAIGGKTGVNLPAGKNLLGTFYQPSMVLVDLSLLETLPEREFRSGLFEALKCGVIRNPAIFEFMEKEHERIIAGDIAALQWLIRECVKVKAGVVEKDERESGERRILNFGHTVGHALEAETGYKYFLHGEAIGWGMIAATMIASAMQKIAAETAKRIIAATMACAPLPKVKVRGKSIARRVHSDKKTANGKARFVLPRTIGEVEVTDGVPDRVIVQTVEELRRLAH